MRKYIFFLIILCSCTNEKDPISPNFITSYLIADTIYIADTNVWPADGPILKISLDGLRIQDEATIKKYAQFFGDTTFNHNVLPLGVETFVVDTCANITIFCNQDFDKNHTKGTPLNDLVTIDYCWGDYFIKSGYAMRKDSYKSEILSEFIKIPHVLIASEFTLKFSQTPTNQGIYSFKINYKFSGGKNLTTTTKEITF